MTVSAPDRPECSGTTLAGTTTGREGFAPELCAAAVWLVACILLVDMQVWHDVAYQLWIARQLNHGTGLYTWIREINPPLWFWMAQPVDLLAGWIGWPAKRVMVAAVFLLIGISLALAARLVALWPKWQRLALYSGMLVATVFVSIGDFAQREHLALIATIPYALLIAHRVEDKRAPSWILALAIGIFAAPMIALKHYLVLIPVMLEVWLIWRQRKAWHPIRPETVALVVGAIGYAGAILIFAPNYLTDIVPVLSQFYGDFRMPLPIILVNQMNLMLAVSAFYFWHFRHELPPAALSALILAAALTATYYIQFKGWGYHVSPVVACLLLALCLHLARRSSSSPLRWTEITMALLMVGTGVLPQTFSGPYKNDFAQAADRLFASLQPGQTAIMFTTKAARPWAAMEEKHLRWPSRYPMFWMMQSVSTRHAAGLPIEGPLHNFIARVRIETVEDLTCNPPDLLINDHDSVNADGFDMLALFREEPRFAALMQSYAVKETLGPFTLYQRTAPLPAPASDCMDITIAR